MDITYRNDLGILEIEPTGTLESRDFQDVAREIEHLRENDRALKGLLIHTENFPGYRKFSDAVTHGEFVREQRDAIDKVALCTDSRVGDLLAAIGKHFAKADVKRFGYDERDEAEKWILN